MYRERLGGQPIGYFDILSSAIKFIPSIIYFAMYKALCF